MKGRNTIKFKNYQDVREEVRSQLITSVKNVPPGRMDLFGQIWKSSTVCFNVKYTRSINNPAITEKKENMPVST